ncbi:MAG: hypothetical protein CMH75_02855 [Nitrospina sp.]|nr:hypothetical protein [Nitrospina sp.]|tara:strand:- start:10851 stop:11489 length:639 start_codon:yes stop_codon:yes gene_type:complete
MTEFIYLHGFASGPNSYKASAFKKRFEELKIPIQIPDLQENDFKNLTLSRQIKLIQSILDNNNKEKYGIIGSSMGGYLACLAAQARNSVKAMYLMAPGFNFLNRWKNKLKLSNNTESLISVYHYGYNKEVLLNTNLFRDAETWQTLPLNKVIPTKIVHGLHDDTVDIQESRNFVASHPWCHLTEVDSDHGLLSTIDWIIEDSLNFFKKQKLI